MADTVQQIAGRLQRGAGHVHLLGAGGIGMAGIARLLAQRGFRVSGCDLQQNRQTEWLISKRIDFSEGHDPAHITDSVEWVVRSTAVPDSHPEVEAARTAGIPVFRRGEVLAALLRDRRTVAVSGTHGKTTTSALIVQVLRRCGMECGWCVGGEVPGLDGVACDGALMVVEADESDGTAALYHPDISVVTNIEFDHMEHHADESSFFRVFERFCAHTHERIFYCGADRHAARICGTFASASDYSDELFDGTGFPLRGPHNRMNARAVLAVCKSLGVPEADIREALKAVVSPARRFEIVAQGAGVTVVSDYAHHPTELRALIGSAKELEPRRILMVFQPHRYTRTRALGTDFPPAFEGIDRLWITPVYAASETPLEGGTAADLIARFGGRENVMLAGSPEEAWGLIRAELRPGDLLLVAGAGDVEKIAFRAAREFEMDG